LTESIGIVLNTIEANMRTEDLLKQSQSLAQQLSTRQEELQKTNEELQEKARLLAKQNEEVERKNAEVEVARQELEEKARQLALTSKYKSEFLANMSHELRTPLNSLLILSDQLSKNSAGNLTPKQTEFAKTIHSSGNDLLNLINDILDLSKIESGTVQVDMGELRLDDLRSFVERTFRHVAEAKNVEFSINFEANLPESMLTDAKRLQQIIKNLLSNAFKFTHHGGVSLRVHPAHEGWSSDNEDLSRSASVLAFEVADTGIGISSDKQQIIFEAFQQADGSTSRKYGGTGLGLAISRELAKLLGGEIRLTSNPGEGSTFTLYLPQSYVPARSLRKQSATGGDSAPVLVATEPQQPHVNPESSAPTPFFADDSANISEGDNVVLIVENDANFAHFLFDMAHENGFKAVVVSRGSSAITLSRELKPQAITLDINLPDIDGWHVLDRLKEDMTTRHIPVHIITTEEERERGLRMGAMGSLTKPVRTKEVLDEAFARIKTYIQPSARRLLIVEGAEPERIALTDLINSEDVQTTAVTSGAEALTALTNSTFDAVVVGLDLPDRKGFDLVDEIRDRGDGRDLPILFYSRRPLSKKEELHLKRLTQTQTLKDVRSPQRVLDDAALFLHLPVSRMSEPQQEMLASLHQPGAVLAGKKVLVVDDDIRNIFAMTSILETQKMVIHSAETGKSALEILQDTPDIDVVLMDIMMPEMDGYDTMRAIRKQARFRSLPIVALTAKAMKGDREKCIEAGASDYIAKPVDAEQLLSLLRVWLHR
jgi:signal transduction histidine kinase/CheY-like chemotaxis protein